MEKHFPLIWTTFYRKNETKAERKKGRPILKGFKTKNVASTFSLKWRFWLSLESKKWVWPVENLVGKSSLARFGWIFAKWQDLAEFLSKWQNFKIVWHFLGAHLKFGLILKNTWAKNYAVNGQMVGSGTTLR